VPPQGTSLANLADETGATPGQISQWRKQALEGLVEVLDRSGAHQEAARAKELAAFASRPLHTERTFDA
jgi:transposase-like protein